MIERDRKTSVAWYLGTIIVITVACNSTTKSPGDAGADLGAIGPTNTGGNAVSSGETPAATGGAGGAGLSGGGGTTKAGVEVGIDAPLAACPQLFSDSGIYPGAALWTWSGGDYGLASSVFEGNSTDCNGTSEGGSCFKTTSGTDSTTATNYAGWGIVAESNKNWNLMGCTRLVFCAQTMGNLKTLKVEVQTGSKSGAKATLAVPIAPGVWQPVVLTKEQFVGADFSDIFGAFLVTANGGDQVFRIDNIRWDNASSTVPPGACQKDGIGGTGGSGAVDASLMDGHAATGGVMGATGGTIASADGASPAGGGGSGGAPGTGSIDSGISLDVSGTGGTQAVCPVLYSDTGIPSGANVITWDGSTWALAPGVFDGSSQDCNGAPEGSACFKTTSGANSTSGTNYAGWGIVTESGKNWDLSACNRLLFCAQIDGAISTLRVEIQESNNGGTKHAARPTVTSGGWQLVTITKDQFGSGSLANIYGPFYVTVENGSQTFRIDNVRWDNGSSTVPACGSPGALDAGNGGGG
jgi:hypothetical protein